MTRQEEKEVIRVCGENYNYYDIPAYIRKRDGNQNQKGVPLKEDSQEKE